MKTRWNPEAHDELRFAAAPLVRSLANQLATRCNAAGGGGYVAAHGRTTMRPRSAVITATYKARKDCAKNNRLVRELGALR